MNARSWLVAALVASAAWLPLGALAGHGGVHVPEARVGDEAIYHEAATGAAAFAFRWLESEATLDRWGRTHTADVLQTLLPASQRHPDPQRDWLPAEEWVEVREAFAGVAYDPVWRLDPRGWTQNGTSNPLPVPLVGFSADGQTNVSWTEYGVAPAIRSCLAHHALQGSAPGASVVPLATLCPAAARFPQLEAEPRSARSATFLGRPAVEFTYDLRGGAGSGGDLWLPYRGMLRVVVADGLPFVAEVEARGDLREDTWHFVQGAYQRGAGPEVPPWRSGGLAEPAAHPAARFHPLEDDGPSDGGSGLPYRLEDALRSLREDVTLAGFRLWSRDHPDAFVMAATLQLEPLYPGTDLVWVNQPLGTEAEWFVTLAAPRADGLHDAFLVSSRARNADQAPLVGPGAPRVVQNTEYGGDLVEGVTQPQGEPAIDFASALRAFRGQVPAPFRDLPIARLDYEAPRGDAPAVITVSSQRATPEPEYVLLGADLALNLSTGAASLLTAYRQSQDWSDLTLGARPLATTSGVDAPLLPQAASLEVLTLTGLAVLAALLAHGGYLTVGYSRLRQSDLLDHPGRLRIHDLVRERPGIHFQGIMASLGWRNGATIYHLRVLERGGLLTSVTSHGFRRYYVNGSVPYKALRSTAELAKPRERLVYEAIRREPGITIGELARRVHVLPSGASRAADRLQAAGLVEKTVHGREVHLVARDVPGNN